MSFPLQKQRSKSTVSRRLIACCLWLVGAGCSTYVDRDEPTAGNGSGPDGGMAGNGAPMGIAPPMPVAGSGGGEEPGDGGILAVCGNGMLEPGELCDDGNTEDGDGCSSDCRSQDAEYDCSTPGEPCVNTVVCGNGILEGGEVCDPGEHEGGCAPDCRSIEAGWACPRPGQPCVTIPVCGNGVRERGEQCDTGAAPDPGCVDCALQEGFFCGIPGEPCVEDVCGNGVLTPGFACDDGNILDGDGCDSECNVEEGWRCSAAGCLPICGDGLVLGDETCDDGNTVSGDGCSASCRIEAGHTCPEPDEPCVLAECGNGTEEYGEGCDDGNRVGGDGCSPTCQVEPDVTVGPDPIVHVFCGDGMVTGVEACDDGNTEDGDGCSSNCQIEEGFTCRPLLDLPENVGFRVTYRDFRQRTEDGGHPHMKVSGSEPPAAATDRLIPGAVCDTDNTETCGRLDEDGKPQLRPHVTDENIEDEHATLHSHPEAFSLWYRSENPEPITGANGAIAVQELSEPTDLLTLEQQGDEDSSTYHFATNSFFPLNGRGFGNTPGQSNNFHFTTELRYFFQYQGGETLLFRGDDDVFVFINGRLAVDLGGIHGPHWGRVVLGDDGLPDGGDSDCSVATTNDSEPEECSLSPEEEESGTDTRFGLTRGEVYEIVLFHAERHPTGSNFVLTLSGFLAPRSFCEPICGDGEVVGWEVCDDGDDNADDTYGVCNTTCTGRSYCGDAIVQDPPEACDNGFNVDMYDFGDPNACAPGCVLPGTCGDGTIQQPFELCDDGQDNDDARYEGCNTQCEWGPFCGDGVVQDEHEACDDGLGPDGNVTYAPESGRCGLDCQPAPYCGDGERNGPEQCDLGSEQNTGAYGGCNTDCTLAPYCGDGVLQASEGEECDDGPIGSVACSVDCRLRLRVD